MEDAGIKKLTFAVLFRPENGNVGPIVYSFLNYYYIHLMAFFQDSLV